MSTKTKRIALTVQPELDSTLTALAELQGIPKTAVIMEFLESVHPAMVQLQKALEDVKNKKSPDAALSALFASMTTQYSGAAEDFAGLLQRDVKND